MATGITGLESSSVAPGRIPPCSSATFTKRLPRWTCAEASAGNSKRAARPKRIPLNPRLSGFRGFRIIAFPQKGRFPPAKHVLGQKGGGYSTPVRRAMALSETTQTLTASGQWTSLSGPETEGSAQGSLAPATDADSAGRNGPKRALYFAAPTTRITNESGSIGPRGLPRPGGAPAAGAGAGPYSVLREVSPGATDFADRAQCRICVPFRTEVRSTCPTQSPALRPNPGFPALLARSSACSSVSS